MEDSTKIIITAIIAFTVIVVTSILSTNHYNPTQMNEQTRQQIMQEEGLE